MSDDAEKPQLIRAAAYVRMSTEHQQYSTNNQMDVILEYASRRGMEIVRTYSDEGKSGLNIQGRDSLGLMISDVESKAVDFTCILVYDVSRWGRFQDADESAYYEYICRRAGIAVHYCAEQFENDGSPVSTIVKGVKRAMAGEYSRELSSKVFQGACRLIQLGFKQGGTAGYGLRRMLIDQNGQHKGLLKIGEQKSLQTDRVILVPGPEEEVAAVRWMYQAFVREGLLESQIAETLNARGLTTDFGRPWTRGTVHQVLTNEKYIGNNVYHRTSFKLKKKHVNNPPDRWIRAEKAFEGIIDPDIFFQAQGIIIERSRKFTNEEMLDRLRHILQQQGRISGILIDEYDVPSSAAFRHRFGSLVTAYSLIGYTSKTDYGFIDVNRRLRRQHPVIVADIIAQIESMGGSVTIHEQTDLLVVNQEFLTSIVLCRHQTTMRGSSRWIIRLDASLRPDITIAARMDTSNEGVLDYYLLPAVDMNLQKLRLAEDNGIYLDTYRFANLDFFFHMAARTTIHYAA
jgi:DNA invertase Pin-like site-specific DNA recombinase